MVHICSGARAHLRTSPAAAYWTVGCASARGGRMKLAELARALGATLEGGSGEAEITGVAAIEDAVPGTLTVLADRRHGSHLSRTQAGAVLLGPDAPASPVPVLRVDRPWEAFAKAMELFHPTQRPAPGIHPTAIVAPTALL